MRDGRGGVAAHAAGGARRGGQPQDQGGLRAVGVARLGGDEEAQGRDGQAINNNEKERKRNQ